MAALGVCRPLSSARLRNKRIFWCMMRKGKKLPTFSRSAQRRPKVTEIVLVVRALKTFISCYYARFIRSLQKKSD